MEPEKLIISKRKLVKGFLTLKSLRDVILLLILFVTAWKLIAAPLTLDLSGFKFTDFLSLIMAIFAVSLSVAFFFKASDTSNKFYDNVYKFTQEVSEILGRIEAGFGERLRHIDEGYTGLRDKFESLPFDLPSAKEKEKEEKKEVEMKEAQLKTMISDLMERAQLAQHEKSSLLSKLNAAQAEIESSKKELHRLQRDISQAEANNLPLDSDLIRKLSQFIPEIMPTNYLNAPDNFIKEKFEVARINNIIPSNVLEEMKIYGILKNNQLTRFGIIIIKEALRLNYDRNYGKTHYTHKRD